jgi:hypothetical protein
MVPGWASVQTRGAVFARAAAFFALATIETIREANWKLYL